MGQGNRRGGYALRLVQAAQRKEAERIELEKIKTVRTNEENKRRQTLANEHLKAKRAPLVTTGVGHIMY